MEKRVCIWCDEEIGRDEPTQMVPMIEADLSIRRGYLHPECFFRSIMGSVGHHQGECSCFKPGASEGDPPGMSRHDAAKAALTYWRSHNAN